MGVVSAEKSNMIKPITIYGNPVLRKECVSIEKTYPGIQEVIAVSYTHLLLKPLKKGGSYETKNIYRPSHPVMRHLGADSAGGNHQPCEPADGTFSGRRWSNGWVK